MDGRNRQQSTAPSAAAGSSSSCQHADKKQMADKMSPPSSRPAPNRQSTGDPPFGSHEGRPVEQYDLATGRMIAQFKNQSDAERATGISNGCISACVRCGRDHAGGYGWRRPGSSGAAANGNHC